MAVPTISIIVPVCKVEKYLQRCIDSILAQTFRDFELILVDDGSPDNCPALCDAAAEKDPRVVVIHQKNGGLSAARNAGLEIARGEWIGFVDSDDYIAPEMYETLYNKAFIHGGGVQLVICSYTYVDENGNKLPRVSPITEEKELDRVRAMNLLKGDRSWYYVTVWNRLYRRELFDTVRFPVGKLHEDEYVAHELFWQCEKILVIPQALYFYVQRDGSIMNTAKKAVRLGEIDAQLERGRFAMEHRLYALAAGSCNGALGTFVPFQVRGEIAENDRAEVEKLEQETRALIERFLKEAPREFWKQKAVLRLFCISPRLYDLALRARQLKIESQKK